MTCFIFQMLSVQYRFNPYVPNAPFLNPLKTENHMVGSLHWEQRGLTKKYIN